MHFRGAGHTSASTVYLPGQRGLVSSRTDRAGRAQTFTYDALDRATSTQDAAKRTTGSSYDGLQRLTGVGNRKNTTALISGYNYGYDNRDVKTFVERQVGVGALQRVNYSYDTVDQLTLERSTEQTPLVNNSFAYDSRDNRSSSSGTTGSVSYVPNALNQVTSYTTTGFGTNTLSYDADGNLTSNAKGSGGVTYTYDEENRLIRITGVNESTGVNERKSEFVYDGQSRKVISREFTWTNGVWVQSSETRHSNSR